jgi:prepilin-type N-terminal cleavage/methylation domain-containing protein
MPTVTRDDGFSLIEVMIATTIMLIVTAATLTTFKNAMDINDTASQLADANQNLRAGTNQLVRDLMMAGRIISDGAVPVPNGVGALAINRPGPPGSALTFSLLVDDDASGQIAMPSLTSGYHLGPVINGSNTDIVTILTVDEFMPSMQAVPQTAVPTAVQAALQRDGSQLTLPATSVWLVGDPANDTPPIGVGDLILFKNNFGMSIQTVTSVDPTHIYFAQNHANDWFHFNQRSTSLAGTLFCIKSATACGTVPVLSDSAAAFTNGADPAMFRVLMLTYYVDNTTTVGTPRLTRVINHCPGSDLTPGCDSFPAFAPQALAGVVEDLDLTYDLVDSGNNSVTKQVTLPVTVAGNTYTSNMIKTVNVHVGVRSEQISKPTQDFIRNHISTAVAVRSLASVDRYDLTQ